MFSLTPSLIAPIAMSVVPMISSAISREDTIRYNNAVCISVRMTLLLALPASIGLAFFSEPILCLIFGSDLAAAKVAASLLSVLALSIIPACLITTTNAILQARGKAARTIFSMICGIIVKLISEYLLVKKFAINIYGAPISTILCDITIVGFNTYFVLIDLHRLKNFYRPIISNVIAAFASVGAAVLLWKTTNLSVMSRLSVLVPIFMAVMLYIAFVLLMGAIDNQIIEIMFSNKNKKKELSYEQRAKNSISAGKETL
jgi:O-antigen/teichoic acid export membrane protein